MPTLAPVDLSTSECLCQLPAPIWSASTQSEGEAGRKLSELCEEISIRWHNQPPRGLVSLPTFWEKLTPMPVVHHRYSLTPICWSRWYSGQLSVQFTSPSITLEQAIHTRFKAVEPVRAVYVQDLSKVQNVFVLVRQDTYDEVLMDRLLDQESDLIDQYPGQLFNIYYLPVFDDEKSPAVPDNAHLLFAR